MPITLRPKTTKQKIRRFLVIFLNAFLFTLLIITTIYFFIHSPALVNKVDNILNHDQQSQKLQEAYNSGNILENTIIIPKVNIYAPIIPVNSNNQEEISNASKEGLAFWKDKGKIKIVGNYSDYFWKKGNYKYILSAIGNLEANDQIGININGEYTAYKVKNIKTIKARDFNELNNIYSDLVIACNWPPGFTRYKLVLEADKIN